MTTDVTVTVIGAGISGAACAVALRDAGVGVRVVERGRAPGGRMASPTLHGRRVDIGAGYFTVRDHDFDAVVDGWASRGLARPWTDTFDVLARGHPPTRKSGPMRWATPSGLRGLVRDLLDGIEVHAATDIGALPDGDVVLAMPDPQAARLVDVPDAVEYDPVVAVVCGYPRRTWALTDAAFVNDHPDIEFVVDDGARRGDMAAVLVAHTTARRAHALLDDPDQAIAPAVTALDDLLGAGAPAWTHAHRWRLAKPAGQHDSTYGLVTEGGRRIGFAGDQWCVVGAPRIESAWRSGTDLGQALSMQAPAVRR